MKLEQTLLLERVPALIGHKLGVEASARNGTILLCHGLGSSKEVLVPEIGRLAASGFLVVALDAVGHGERNDPNLAQLVIQDSPAHSTAYLGVVRESAKELPPILDELQSRGWIYRERIGIAGISMGGHICFLAITLDPRFKVAVTILASPEWESTSAASPHLHLESFSHIKLLSQNAGRDEIVPSADVARFHARLKGTYDDHEQRFDYIEYPGSGHFMGETDWNLCIDKMAAWFVRHLPR